MPSFWEQTTSCLRFARKQIPNSSSKRFKGWQSHTCHKATCGWKCVVSSNIDGQRQGILQGIKNILHPKAQHQSHVKVFGPWVQIRTVRVLDSGGVGHSQLQGFHVHMTAEESPQIKAHLENHRWGRPSLSGATIAARFDLFATT
eukprot:3875223-Amphidinium_carterae.2